LADYNWIFGISMMFAIALLMNVLIRGDGRTFFLFLVVMCALVVWAGLLDLWVLILAIIGSIIVLFISIKQKGVG